MNNQPLKCPKCYGMGYVDDDTHVTSCDACGGDGGWATKSRKLTKPGTGFLEVAMNLIPAARR